ncbi:hypothetical protein Tco_0773390 [Tanacetum coccineum]|uniref:Uncharacterized protein n=1 Tax=Tanacetum coccineum TaxID=301880 RepID=A0ABQ4ZKJ4_9ASTR
MPDTEDTIIFKMDSQEIVYIVDMFRNTLQLPVETPEKPFVVPANIKIIESFMNRVGYQGVVDKVSAFYTKFLAQPWQTMFKQSRFLRYIDTRPNGDALRKCILQGPYTLTTVTIPAVPTTENSLAVPERTAFETILTMSPENKAHYESEKEAIHLLFTEIRDEIYSTIDACKTAHEMWIAIERLQQGESLNIQDVKTNLFWEFGKFTSRDGESIESYYSRIYKMMNEMIRKNLTVATMQEVNEIYAERIAKNANPLAIVVAASQYPDPYYQAPKSHKSFAPPSKQASSTRSNTSIKHKGKEIAKPITPPSESASEEDSDPEQAQRDKDMQKNLAPIAKYFKKIYKSTNNNLRTSSNSRNKNVDTTPRYKNDNQTGQFRNQRTVTVAGARETVGMQETKKGKKNSMYHKEKMLLCKQDEKGVPLQVEQSDWLADTDEEIDEQELEAHYSFMAKIKEQPESTSNTCLVEKDDSNVTPDSSDMCDNDIQTDQNAEDKRAAHANLIANLKLDVDENKKIQKQLKKENASLSHELKECKFILAETSRTLGESNIDYDKLERKLNETLGLLAQKEIDIKEGLKVKACEISVVKEKHDELVKQSLLTKSHFEATPNKKFQEPPLEKEILAFLASLGHSGDIRKITDVNVNKLHQPWRSFAAIINKCLSGKPSYDSLRLSQAQIVWGMYNKKNVDYAYLLWEDFIFQIENKNTKKGNAMYYPRFTKLVVNFVMDKDPSIPRRNKVNWHYARDDPMFTTINVISRNEDTQLYGTILPVALTNKDIHNSESYKEYYVIASENIPPKTKGSKKKVDTDATTKQKPPTAPKEKKEKKSGKGKQKAKELETISEAVLTEAEQLKIITKRSRKETHSSHTSGSGADEGTGVTPGVPDAPTYDSDDDISWKLSDDVQDDDKLDDDEKTQDDEDDDIHDDDENA